MAIAIVIGLIVLCIGIGMSTHVRNKDNELSEQFGLRKTSDEEHWGGIILGILIVGGCAAFVFLH